jgi:oligopeptide transport system permease protein
MHRKIVPLLLLLSLPTLASCKFVFLNSLPSTGSNAGSSNASPIVPMIISEFIGILSGSMVLEQLYQIPGVGSLFVSALDSKDYPIVMADMAIYTTIGLFATLIIDLSYGIVDPRIRMGAVK